MRILKYPDSPQPAPQLFCSTCMGRIRRNATTLPLGFGAVSRQCLGTSPMQSADMRGVPQGFCFDNCSKLAEAQEGNLIPPPPHPPPHPHTLTQTLNIRMHALKAHAPHHHLNCHLPLLGHKQAASPPSALWHPCLAGWQHMKAWRAMLALILQYGAPATELSPVMS